MKILFISTSIPPCTDMQTTRNIYLIKSLIESGNEVEVLTCGEYQPGQSSFDFLLNKIPIYRTRLPLIYRWHMLAQKVLKHSPFLKLHNVLINYYAKPDLYTGWDKVALQEIRKNRLWTYDAVITSSGSYTAHIVGKIWRETCGKKWIAEYGDPWGIDAQGNVNPVYFEKEKALLKNCNGLVFTTQATVKAYQRNYDLDVPYCLVPCGYGEIIEDQKANRRKGKELLFTYTGVAYKKARNLEPFLTASENCENVFVRVVGSYSEDFKKSFKEKKRIEFTGRVKYQDSLDMLSESDALVHIGNFGSLQIPGKTYIYLSTQKPILYIQQEETNDPTYEVLSDFEGIVFCKNNTGDIKRAIQYMAEHFDDLKKQSIHRTKSEKLKKYQWGNLGKVFTEFVMK